MHEYGSRQQAIEEIREGARDNGCQCEVEIRLVQVFGGVWIAEIAHDFWCPLIAIEEGRMN